MKKDKTIFFICIALFVGIIIGVLLCFFLRPFTDETSTQSTKATAEFVDQTLVGKYCAVSEDVSGSWFELKEDGTYRGTKNTGTWIRKGDLLHVSCACYDNGYLINGSPVYCEYEYLFYITEDGLIFNNRLYAKVV